MKGIIKSKTRGNLIVISGPSGAGKGSIIQGLLDSDPSLWLSVSMTSRKIRGQEVEGREYYFITREEFLKKVEDGEFLEYAEYNGNKIIVDIIKGKVIKGGFPSKQLKLILAWTIIHQDELMQNWELSKDGKPLNRINPLI